MPELDDELMERYQKGDENAFTLLVRRHQQPLVNFIARFINDKDSAEDLAQETFIRIFKAANRYKSEGRTLRRGCITSPQIFAKMNYAIADGGTGTESITL